MGSNAERGGGEICRTRSDRPWRWPPTPSSAEVKERMKLYLYSPSGSSSPVLGWNVAVLYTRKPQTRRTAAVIPIKRQSSPPALWLLYLRLHMSTTARQGDQGGHKTGPLRPIRRCTKAQLSLFEFVSEMNVSAITNIQHSMSRKFKPTDRPATLSNATRSVTWRNSSTARLTKRFWPCL